MKTVHFDNINTKCRELQELCNRLKRLYLNFIKLLEIEEKNSTVHKELLPFKSCTL